MNPIHCFMVQNISYFFFLYVWATAENPNSVQTPTTAAI